MRQLLHLVEWQRTRRSHRAHRVEQLRKQRLDRQVGQLAQKAPGIIEDSFKLFTTFNALDTRLDLIPGNATLFVLLAELIKYFWHKDVARRHEACFL